MLPCNVDAVAVFRECKPTVVVGLGSAAWLGFSALEIRAALAVHRIPPSRWLAVVAGVRVMEAATAEIRNAEKPKTNPNLPPPTTRQEEAGAAGK